LHPSDNAFRTRDSPDFEEDFVEKDPTGRYIRVCMHHITWFIHILFWYYHLFLAQTLMFVLNFN
jgi:hypothetical protein